MKKILFILFLSSFIFLIFMISKNPKVTILSISDKVGLESDNYNEQLDRYLRKKNKLNQYINAFSQKFLRTTDLINIIERNEDIRITDKKRTIKNLLIKADITIISVGSNDLIDHLLIEDNRRDCYIYINQYLSDVEKLFILLRNYSKEKILFLEIYNPNHLIDKEYIEYVNNQLQILCYKYDIDLIDYQKKLTNEMFFNKNINEKGQKMIYKEILKKIKV